MLIHRPLYFWIQRLLCLSPRVVVFFLFLLLPFQKKFPVFLHKFSDQTVPAELALPDFFYHQMEFFPSDLVIFFLVLLVFLQAPKTLMNQLFTSPVRWLVIFCITAFFSIAFSPLRHYVLQYVRLLQFSTVILLFCSIEYIVAQNKTRQLIKWVAWAMVITAFMQCVIASVQYFSQTSMGFYKFERVLFFSLLSAAYLYIIQKKRWIKCILVLSVFVHFFVLSISYCRVAIIACAVSIIFWLIVQHFWIKETAHKKETKKMGCIFLISSVVCLGLIYRGVIVNHNQVTQYVDEEKMDCQEIIVKMIQENPWTGIGFNNFPLCINPAQFGLFSHAKMHNMYILIAVETGIMGLIFFSIFLFSIVKNAVKRPFSQEQALLLSVFIGFLWIGCCNCYLIEQMYGRVLFFTSLALLNAVTQKAYISQSHLFLQKRVFFPKS